MFLNNQNGAALVVFKRQPNFLEHDQGGTLFRGNLFMEGTISLLYKIFNKIFQELKTIFFGW